MEAHSRYRLDCCELASGSANGHRGTLQTPTAASNVAHHEQNRLFGFISRGIDRDRDAIQLITHGSACLSVGQSFAPDGVCLAPRSYASNK